VQCTLSTSVDSIGGLPCFCSMLYHVPPLHCMFAPTLNHPWPTDALMHYHGKFAFPCLLGRFVLTMRVFAVACSVHDALGHVGAMGTWGSAHDTGLA
jgi:hypothetical protein